MQEIFKNYPDVVSVPQVSKMLNLSIPVVYRLLQSGDLRAKKVGTKYVIAKKSVIEFLFSEVNIRPDTLTTHFKSFLVRNNLPVIRLHKLRHSCASILIASGVSMKAVQEWLGHSTFSTTADIYSHLNYLSKLNIAETLAGIFDGKPVLQTQDDSEVMTTIQKIFYSSDMLDEPPEKPVKQAETFIEETDQPDDEENDIAEFKHVRDEMERLGFEMLDEYFDYLDYIEQRQKRKSSSIQM